MKSSVIRVLIVLLAVPICSGCWLLRVLGFPVGEKIPYSPITDGSEVTVHRDIQFADIPVPMGFLLDRKKSYSFRGSTFRFGTFRYEGAWTQRKTTDFYRRQMPVSGWTELKDEERDQGYVEVTYFLYSKGRERCEIKVTSEIESMIVTVRVFNAKEGI